MSKVTYRSYFRVLGSRFVFGVRGSVLPFRVRSSTVAALIVLGTMATGCAAKGGSVATPRPFPGASVPAASAPPASGPAEVAAVASPAEGVQLPLLSLALSLRGTPYRNGGSDPSGFDCSGFVQWVFAQQGMALPREVRQQYQVGDDIDDDDVQPGDLVFFETVSRGASHVGIALGGGEFVHAPSSNGVVRVERYTSGYWADRWIGARRVS
jgi:cell wall-associated NlpC family hydrolase